MTTLLNCQHRTRSGVTLVELLIYLGLLGVVGGGVVFLLFSSSEDRIRQEVRASVEQEGIHLLQSVVSRVERAERITLPLRLATGSVLVLQMEGGVEDPTIILSQSGTLMLIQRETERLLSSPHLTVSELRFRNTSPSVDRPSVLLSFLVSRSVPLPGSPLAARRFERTVALFPESSPTGNSCGCAPPSCTGGWYTWGVCDGGSCRRISGSGLSIPLQCPHL